MADVRKYTEQIAQAVYGEEVRGSIINAINAMNDEAEEAIEKTDTIPELEADVRSALEATETAIENANTATVEANTATENAAIATGNAIEATENANAAAEAAREIAQAENITYDNTESAIEAENVQDAIDYLVEHGGGGGGGDSTVPSMTYEEYKANYDKYNNKLVNITDHSEKAKADAISFENEGTTMFATNVQDAIVESYDMAKVANDKIYNQKNGAFNDAYTTINDFCQAIQDNTESLKMLTGKIWAKVPADVPKVGEKWCVCEYVCCNPESMSIVFQNDFEPTLYISRFYKTDGIWYLEEITDINKKFDSYYGKDDFPIQFNRTFSDGMDVVERGDTVFINFYGYASEAIPKNQNTKIATLPEKYTPKYTVNGFMQCWGRIDGTIPNRLITIYASRNGDLSVSNYSTNDIETTEYVSGTIILPIY